MRNQPPLTDQQGRVFSFVQRYIDENGWAPTYDEIAEAMGFSRPRARKYVERLAELGYLVVGEGARTIRVLH